MKYTIFVLLLTIFTINLQQTVIAQTVGMSQTTINLELAPENPKPNDLVYVSLSSFATDINSANISWIINGRVIKSGVGQKSFSFNVGGVNTTTTLGVSIETTDGEIIERSLAIKPTEIDMIWQSESFVPPFYKGKALFSHQNKVTVIAVPHVTGSNGQEINPKNLIYRWEKNGTVMEDVSGYGKNSYTFEGSIISRSLRIDVEVSQPNSGVLGFGSVFLEPTEPTLVLYRKDPAYGIQFQKALKGTVSLVGTKEITVVSSPFFFGIKDPSSFELERKWMINGVSVNNELSATTQIFRQKEGTSGVSKISVNVENVNKILQYASANFNLTFENNEN
jgi:hypothetical protein